MDEYVDFVSESLRHGSAANFVRQKELEERIMRPFDLSMANSGPRSLSISARFWSAPNIG